MVIGNNTGLRCPNCGAAATWEVDACDACGYRSEALRGWEREEPRRKRREWAEGWSFWDWWVIGDVIEGLVWASRFIVGAARTIVSAWF